MRDCLLGHCSSLLINPHAPPPGPNLPLGLAAIQKGKAVGAKTQRERDYIDALDVFYTDYDKVPHAARVNNASRAATCYLTIRESPITSQLTIFATRQQFNSEGDSKQCINDHCRLGMGERDVDALGASVDRISSSQLPLRMLLRLVQSR